MLKRCAMGSSKHAKSQQKTGKAVKPQPAPPRHDEYVASLLDLSPDCYWEQDEQYRFTRVTYGAHAKAGFNEKDFLGTTRWDRGGWPIDDTGGWKKHKATLKARKPFTDFLFKRPDPGSELRYISTSGQPVFDDQGRFRAYRGIDRDVTERIQMELRLGIEHGVTHVLAESNSIVEAAPQIIRVICETLGWSCGARWAPDERGEAIHCAESWGVASAEIDSFLESTQRQAPSTQLGGLNRRAWLQGEPLWIQDVTKEETFRRGPDALNAGLHSAFAFPIRAGAQSIGVMEFFSREIHQPDAELLNATRFIGSQIGQFMQRKQAEAALRESEERFRAAMDASADLMLLIDPTSFRYIDVNDTACRALGYTREELLAMGPQDIFSKSREELAHLYDRLLAGDLTAPTVEGVYLCKDGSQLPIEAYPRAVRSEAGAMIVSIARDIRERKRAEQLRALEHAVNRSIADAASVHEALKQVIRHICKTEGWECGRYLSVDERAGVLRFSEAWSVPSVEIERYIEESRGMVYGPGVGVVGRVWQSGQPLWVADIGEDDRVARSTLARETGMHGAFAVAVLSEGKTIGVLIFHSREIREPDARLLQAIRVIGSQIGQFLQRKQAEEVLRDSEERFRSLTSLSSDWFWEQDAEFRFTRFEGRPGIDSGETIFGTDIISKRYWETGVEIEDGWEVHRALLLAHKSYRDVVVMSPVLPDGKRRYFSLSGEPIVDHSGRFTGYRGVTREITESKLSEERIQYLATHDGLTNLPNRSMFSQIMHLAIQSAQRYQRHFAVLFLDLDRFKIINDTLGHDAGDTLLQVISRRVKESLRLSDVVARLGGDEFVVLVQEVNDPEVVVTITRKLLSVIMKPVIILGQECRVTASIGISIYPKDAQDEQTLMKNADIAMYLAKEQGKNNFQFYSTDIETQSLERLSLETSLRRALEREEFFLHYQAKLDLKTGAINGVETLLRWQHPDLGLVSPMQFIPLAEETGLIVPIGKWVLRTACAQNVAWQRAGLPPVCMAVNLSPRQFTDEMLLSDLAAVLQETGMAPALLELEITESMVMGNIEQAARQLAAIKHMGVRLAIDDFGTGYSSLAQIKRFPIDTIKVDRSFIREIPNDTEDKAITEAIIAMGKSLSLTVVAEGVETREQQAYLRDHACDEMQGFYFSKPVAPDQFAELLRTHVADPSSKQSTGG